MRLLKARPYLHPRDVPTWTLPEIVAAIESASEEPRTPAGFTAMTHDELAAERQKHPLVKLRERLQQRREA